MAFNPESSSSYLPNSTSTNADTNTKPVLVRVKRKASQSRLHAFWLEINERPLKRPLLDFEKLSLSDPFNSTQIEKLKSRRVLVQHVDTLRNSEVTIDVLQSHVPRSTNEFEVKKSDERRCTFKKETKQDQLLSKAREKQEGLAKNARFKQIWRSRRGDKKTMHDERLGEICDVYDVVRIESEHISDEKQVQEDISLEDQMVLRNLLPLLRDCIPSAAAEIESEIGADTSAQDDYVYDVYAVKDDLDMGDEDPSNPFPLVQVDNDDDFYDDPLESEYETDDSNAEDNPLNDYPDEIGSEDGESEASDELKSESENESVSDSSSNDSTEPEHYGEEEWSED